MARPRGPQKAAVRLEVTILDEFATHLKGQLPEATSDMARLNSLSGAIQTIETAVTRANAEAEKPAEKAAPEAKVEAETPAEPKAKSKKAA